MSEIWDTSLPDWEARLLAGKPLVPDLPLFEEEAERALRVFKRLRLPDVIGTPTMAEACGEWFFPIVAALFGSYDPVRNVRHVQELFQLIPKGNSKSSNGGALMVTAMIVNRRPEAEFLLIAPTKEIADIAFKQARGTINLDPELVKLFKIQDNFKKVTHRKSGATLQIKAADTDVITGSKAVGTMIDETHVFAKKANAKDVFVELRGALTKRPDGFLFQTTTQSKAPPAGVFASELSMARAVRDGKMRMPLLPVLYELPDRLAKSGQWRERKYWPMVNPNLGRSTNEDFLAREIARADEEGPASVALIASQHFNVQVGLSLQEDRWGGAEFWEAAGDRRLTLNELLTRSEVATVGIDGGGLDDLLGVAVIGREKETRRWLLWNHAFANPIVLQRRKEIAATLQDFADEGSLTFSNVPDDVRQLAEIVAKVKSAGILPYKNGVGFDPNNIGTIVEELAARGIADEMLRRLMQGPALSPALWGIERKLSDATLTHSGSAMMAWCVGNAKVEVKGNGNMVTKQAAGRAKIDPFVATLCAAILMSWNPEAVRPSLVLL